MTLPQVQSLLENAAQISVERVLNSLPEGLLIAFFVWLVLRILGRQNGGTRFAVWITALIAVAALPFLSGLNALFGRGNSLPPVGGFSSQFSVPRFWIAPISVLWAMGAGVATARLVAGLWQVRKIRKSCTVINLDEIDASMRDQFLDAHKLSRTSRPVAFAKSDVVRVPAAIGFWNPMIVLPSWILRELSPHDLKVILIHELAHVGRRDDWTNLLQKIVRAIFFFHPAVWWIDSRLSLEREMACDDAVVAETGNPRAYASCLIGLLEKSCARRGWTMAQAAVRRAHEASLRIAQILDPQRSTTAGVRRLVPGITVAFSVVCAGALLWAPRLVAFSPDVAAIGTRAVEPSYTDVMTVKGMRAATVVPAVFHLDASARSAIATRADTSGLRLRTAVRHDTRRRDSSVSSPVAVRETGARTMTTAKTYRDNSQAMPALAVMKYTEIENAPLHVDAAVAVEQGSHVNRLQQNWFVQTIQYVDSDGTFINVRVWRLILLAPSVADSQDGAIGKSI